MVVPKGAQNSMTDYPILFNQTPDKLRRSGAKGGRAHARNWRARRRAAQIDSLPMAPRAPLPMETTAAAIAALDVQFPWLSHPRSLSSPAVPNPRNCRARRQTHKTDGDAVEANGGVRSSRYPRSGPALITRLMIMTPAHLRLLIRV